MFEAHSACFVALHAHCRNLLHDPLCILHSVPLIKHVVSDVVLCPGGYVGALSDHPLPCVAVALSHPVCYAGVRCVVCMMYAVCAHLLLWPWCGSRGGGLLLSRSRRRRIAAASCAVGAATLHLRLHRVGEGEGGHWWLVALGQGLHSDAGVAAAVSCAAGGRCRCTHRGRCRLLVL